MEYNYLNIFKIIITVFLFSIGIYPVIKKIAYHVGALDIPGERKIHKNPIPRLGGLIIFLGFLFGYILFASQNTTMIAILIGSFIIILTGVLDDIKPLDAKTKLIGQILASLVVVFYGHILLDKISAFGITLDFGIFAPIVTILFIVALINCLNLIDGLDGLAAGISSIFFATVIVIAVLTGAEVSFDLSLTFIMLGATLGFLVFNFNPAKIFMGDSGSMFLGFIISVICLLGFKSVTLTSFIVPMFILAIPILDTLFAILRRKIKGKSIATPDSEHLHHQLLKMNLGQKKTVLIIYGINILFSITSIIYVLKDALLGKIMYGILTIIIVWFILTTNIIFDHEKIEKIFKKK